MKSHVRRISLSAVLVTAYCSFAFVDSQIASANSIQTVESAPKPVGSAWARLENLKGEIENLNREAENTITSIAEIQEKNRCLGVVYSSLTALTNQIDALGDRSTVTSLAARTHELVKTHAVFFERLNDFSKQSLLLVGSSDLVRAGDEEEISRLVSKVAELMQNLRQQYQSQADEELRLLADISAAMRRLQQAGSSALRGFESTKQCAPHLIEKHTKAMDAGLKVLNKIDKSRARIADLQSKRSRILGALFSAFKKKFSAQLAELSGKKADDLVTQINASLVALSLRTEIERWWFAESLEKGPARGFLSGENENLKLARDNLRLAIASCDNFIARVKEIYAHPALAQQRKDNNSAQSALENALYNRRAALGLWLEQANHRNTASKH